MDDGLLVFVLLVTMVDLLLVHVLLLVTVLTMFHVVLDLFADSRINLAKCLFFAAVITADKILQ